MSEDASAKGADRRRRTTRAGRRKPPRMPAGVAGDSWPPPSWPPEAGTEGAEAQGEGGNDDTGAALEGGDTLESDEGLELEPAGEDGEDKRATAELHVTPLLTTPLPPSMEEDAKTNPRLRVEEITGAPSHDPDSAPTFPQIKTAAVTAAVEAEPRAASSSVIIARAHVISDPPPPPRPRPDLPPPSEARTASAMPVDAEPEVNGDSDTAYRGESSATSATRDEASTASWSELEALEAARPAESRIRETPAAELRPPVPAPPPPASSSEPAPPQAQPASTDSELDDTSLQLVDVEDAEADGAPRISRVPPPPPPARVEGQAPPNPLPAPSRTEASPRLKPPPPVTSRTDPQAKRPPPPPSPGAGRADEDRQKRKQVRQWWERFFSDDYLMTVLPPSPAQISRQVDFVEASLGLNKGATVLDVGCGLGLHSVELTRRGYLVVGLDLSLAMITRAAEASQEQGLKINFVHADIREMEFDGTFDGVICMGTTFGFFDDEANRDVLARLHHALRPGGRMLLDLVNRDYVVGLQPNLVWFEGDECVCMEESDFNYFNSRLSVKRTMMREDGRQSNAEYSLRLYSLHELGQLVQQIGFRVIEVSGQEAIRGAFFGAHSPRILMLAERRSQPRSSNTTQADPGRPSLAFPIERNSNELPKPPKPE